MSSTTPSVAITRFKDIGWFGKFNWLGSGISNTFTEKFSYLPSLRVLSVLAVAQVLDANQLSKARPHKSSRAFYVLRQLPANFLCYGTIRVKDGDSELSSQIVSNGMPSSNADHRWTGSYSNFLSALNAVAKSLAESLQQMVSESNTMTPEVYDKFTCAGIPSSLAAYQMFCRGTHTRIGPEKEFFYREATRIDPNYASAYAGLGTHYARNGRLREAVDCFKRRVELAPHSHHAHSDLGTALTDLKQFDEAERELQKAIELYPQGDPDVFSNLGALYQNRQHLDDAMAQYQKAHGLNPYDPDVAGNMGRCWFLRGDLPKTKEWLQKAINLYGPLERHKRKRAQDFLDSL